MNSRNNTPNRHGHVLSVIKSQKAMTNMQFTSTTGPSMKGGTCTSALLTHVQLMVTHLGMMSSTWSGGICRRTMACAPLWGVPRYTTEAALMQHKEVHKGTAKKYVCSLCGKASSSTTALHRHEKIHKDN